MFFPFAATSARHPLPADRERLDRGIERFREAAERLDDAAARRFVGELLERDVERRLLDGIFGCSPFLSQCLIREAAFVPVLFSAGPDAAFEGLMAEMRALTTVTDGAAVGAALRMLKRRVSLTSAVADLAGLWPLETVTGRLSTFCDRALGAALNNLLVAAHTSGAIELPDPEFADQGCGLFVLGMGKLGANELNYSSDIDLIVLFDDEVVKTPKPEEMQTTFVRLTRNLVKQMEERTAEGYVFRTDLRLRPDPGATPVALSTLAA